MRDGGRAGSQTVTARLTQPIGLAAGSALLRLSGLVVEDPAAVELAVVQSGAVDRYLDPRNPDDPWVTSVYRFRPVAPRRDGADFVCELDYGIAFHLRANRPYRLLAREGTREQEDRFTGIAMRQPSNPPTGWVPPPDPRGPLQAPPPIGRADPATAPAVEQRSTPASDDAVIAGADTQAVAGIASDATPSTDAESDSSEPTPDRAPGPAQVSAPATETASPPCAVTAPPLEPSPAPHPTREPSLDPAREPTPAPTPGPDPVPVPKRHWPAAAIAVVLLTAFAGWWWSPPMPEQAHPKEESTPPDPKPLEREARKDPEPEPIGVDAARRFVAGDPAAEPARDLGQRYVARGSLDGAFLLLRHAAAKGDAQAARMVGTMYDPATHSQSTSPLPAPNPAEAARWYRAAADAGDAQAQYLYAMLLRSGRTEGLNGPEIAVQWLERAAAQGHEAARKALGREGTQ